jgi:hypothetical protein
MAKTISDGDLLKYGWKMALEKLGFFIGLFLLTILAFIGLIIIGVILVTILGEDLALPVVLLTYLSVIVLSLLVNIGWIRISLALVDGKKTDLAMLFKNWDAFWRFLGATLLYGLVVMAGYILFIIPGVIWSLKYMWMPWLVVDKKMGVLEAMEKSSNMTMGLKWDLLGFQILTVIVSYLGFLALGVGALVTTPTVLMATAKLYRSHSK